MQVSRIVIIPMLLSCVIACDDSSNGGVVLGYSPGETDEGNAEIGMTTDDGADEGDTGEEEGSHTLRIILGGHGSQFNDNMLNNFAGGSSDGLLVSLYIDPTTSYYEWKAFHGGGTNEWIQDLAVDTNGRICGSGWSNSTNLPTTANAPQKTFGGGQRDIFAGCWDANGSLLYSTYLGGKLAELNDNALSITPLGNVVVTGATNSINLKTTTGAVQAAPQAGNNGLAFNYAVAGSITWGTYLGGIGADTVGIHNDVGADGSVWMIGNSDSPNFPVTDGSSASAQDMAVARISSNGATLELGTLVGGTAADYGIRIAALPDGTAIACGHTLSEDFPATMDAVQTTHGSQLSALNFDVTLTHLDSDGTILAATYLGGTGYDACTFLGVDDAGDVYVNGWTDNLDDFPLTSTISMFGPRKPGVQEGFLVKIDPDFEAIEWAVRTTVARGMDVLGDGRVVLLGPEDPGVSVTANAIPGESSNLLIVYGDNGVSAEYVGYVVGEGMGVKALEAIELP